VRARKNKLVSDQTLQNYVQRPLEDVLYTLEDEGLPELTAYLEPDVTYASIDNALRNHFIAEIQELRRISPEPVKSFLKAYLEKFKVRLIKNVVRRQNTTLTETTSLLPRGLRFSIQFRELTEPTLKDLEQELTGTPYRAVLEKHLDQIREGNLYDFEHDLNILYLERLHKKAQSKNTKKYVKKHIDRLNLTASLKNTDEYAKGGRINREALHNATTLQQYKEALHDAGYDIEAKTLQELETGFKQHIERFAHTLLGKQPLSDAGIVAYLILKSRNMEKLNILLKLKYHDTEPHKILDALNL
jgi:vacuolar-type H+-ATPase subunit C/Vma6